MFFLSVLCWSLFGGNATLSSFMGLCVLYWWQVFALVLGRSALVSLCLVIPVEHWFYLGWLNGILAALSAFGVPLYIVTYDVSK